MTLIPAPSKPIIDTSDSKIVRDAILAQWRRGFDEGQAIGFQRGWDAGKTTLSRGWFILVLTLTGMGAGTAGMVLAEVMQR